jgi:Pyruvate/2-oxoacid:ferredoxin oxidoreductase gamma subunit
MRELTVGIGGAAGDGLDKTGDTLAKTASRLGLYVYAYNSYQSVIRGGHIWLRVRLAEGKVYSHGDSLNVLIALNQDAIERHAKSHPAAPSSTTRTSSSSINRWSATAYSPRPCRSRKSPSPLARSSRSCRTRLDWAR